MKTSLKSQMNILAITFPIYLLIAVGFIAVKYKYIDKSILPHIGKFVASFALPVLIFRTISSLSLKDFEGLGFLFVYGTAALIIFFAAVIITKARGLSVESGAVRGMGMVMSNSAFVGYSISQQIAPQEAHIVFALCAMTENLLMMPLITTLLDHKNLKSEKGYNIKPVIIGVLKNPFTFAAVSGFCVAYFNIDLGAPFKKAVDMLANASVAPALILIGGNLTFKLNRSAFLDLSSIAFGKLIIHPLFVYIGLILLGGFSNNFIIVAIIFAASPMISVFPILAQKNNETEFCATTLTITTLVSFFSMNLILHLFQNL